MIYSSQVINLAIQILELIVQIQTNDNIMLQVIGFHAIGLVRAFSEEIRERKAHPYLKIDDPEINRMILASGDEAVWEKQARLHQLPLMEHMNAFIGIRGAENIYE